MKYKIKSLTGKKISFDFDGTLEDDFDNTINPQKEEIQSILKEYLKSNNDVYIITKRYSPENSNNGKINEHIDVYRMAVDLGIPGNKIIFTNRTLKSEIIRLLGIDIHFENSQYEVDEILKYTDKVKVVLITDPYWRDLVY